MGWAAGTADLAMVPHDPFLVIEYLADVGEKRDGTKEKVTTTQVAVCVDQELHVRLLLHAECRWTREEEGSKLIINPRVPARHAR